MTDDNGAAMTDDQILELAMNGKCLAVSERREREFLGLDDDAYEALWKERFRRAVEAAEGDANSIMRGMARLLQGLAASDLSWIPNPTDATWVQLMLSACSKALASASALGMLSVATQGTSVGAMFQSWPCKCPECQADRDKEAQSGGADDDRR